MDPMLPEDRDHTLRNLAVEVIKQSAGLGTCLHPITREVVADLVRAMNCYYSNLIEGHNTHPVDIEKALAQDYSTDPARRARQLESFAHIEVQSLVEQLLKKKPDSQVCARKFLCWIHEEFYRRLPDEFRQVRDPNGTTRLVEPGKLRVHAVEVGRHLAPDHKSLEAFLDRFSEVYEPTEEDKVSNVIAAAASHHRLAWIHPFLDGNGRVMRIFTHAFMIKTDLSSHGLWAVSRGLARNRETYLTALAKADEHRRGDYDGRGSLSNIGFAHFCRFFLETIVDQIDFMSKLLDLDGMQRRIKSYVNRLADFGELSPESFYLLQDVFLRGEVPRGEAPRILGRPERSARRILKQLLDMKLVTSDSSKSPLRLAIPMKAAGYYFPRLYPEGVEMDAERW